MHDTTLSLRTLALAPALALLACDPGLDPAALEADDSTPLQTAEPAELGAELLAAEAPSLASASLHSVAYHAEGIINPPNEGLLPSSTDLSFPYSQYELDLVVDPSTDRLRIDRQGNNPFPGFVIDQVERIDGPLGVAEGPSAAGPLGPMPSDRVAALRRMVRLLNPLLLLSEVEADPSLVQGASLGLRGGALVLDLTLSDVVAPIEMEVELLGPTAPSVRRLLTEENDLLTRDSSVEIEYGDWQWVSGWRLPHHVELFQDGMLVRSEDRSAYVIDGPIDDEALALPPGPLPPFDPILASKGERSAVAQLGLPPFVLFPDGRPADVVPVEVVPGVYFLTGTLHNSLLVEQQDRLVLVEAPAYPERSEAIDAWASATFPTKSITHVVATHFHSDHTAGLRHFVAQGATVVVGEATRDFFADDVFARSSTIIPDALELAPVEDPEVVGVPATETTLLDDPLHPVQVRPVPSLHAADMVVAYLPQDEVLFNSDLFSPGFPASFEALLAGATELQAAIVDQGLAVSWMPSGHGFAVPTYADFLAEFGF